MSEIQTSKPSPLSDTLLGWSFLISVTFNSLLVCWVGGSGIFHPHPIENAQTEKKRVAELAAVGFIVLWEMLNRSIRRPVELSQGLGIQPIATIPYIRTAGEQRRKRTVILAVLALIAIGIPFALFAIDAHYMPLDELLGGLLD